MTTRQKKELAEYQRLRTIWDAEEKALKDKQAEYLKPMRKIVNTLKVEKA